MMLNIKNARIRTRQHPLAAMIAKVEQGEQIIIHLKGSRRLILQTDQSSGKGPPHRHQAYPINRADHRGMLIILEAMMRSNGFMLQPSIEAE